jgi:hypothetical protein
MDHVRRFERLADAARRIEQRGGPLDGPNDPPARRRIEKEAPQFIPEQHRAIADTSLECAWQALEEAEGYVLMAARRDILANMARP